jgi:hypothetical protein
MSFIDGIKNPNVVGQAHVSVESLIVDVLNSCIAIILTPTFEWYVVRSGS